MAFKPVDPKQNLPKLEQALLKFWDKRGIFQKSIDSRESKDPQGRKRPAAKGDYVFFDGPPGTNGKPHIGHMMQSALKDVWPRFKTMQGYRVLRKAGWDTHGLPIELQAEKELGLDSKRDIHNLGLTKYVAYCRNTVFRYVKDWEVAIKRIGRFLDTTDAYATLTNDFIQTDWWVIKQAHQKGLLYKDFKVLPYCSRCGTSLSSHEVAQGYQEVTETSVFVKFPLKGEPRTSLLIWTTTPWTLVANVAVAVGPEVKYVRVRPRSGADKKERLILAKALADQVLGEGTYEIEEEFDGHALAGKTYQPPYNFFNPREKAFYVVVEDFVTTEDGAGLVHMAAYGEDDYKVIKKYKLPLIQHLDWDGTLKKEVTKWQGKNFKEVDKEVVRDLKERGLLLKAVPYKHSYPFCWRCKTPLIYNAQSSWFIRTTAFKDKMIAANKRINWQPEHIRSGRFGKWLEENVDWAISRARYWGTPLPVWICQKCQHVMVVENIEELRKLATKALASDEQIDLHKPAIDAIKLRCTKCAGEALREPDVLDCWFNAGNMPWGQWGYPHKAGSLEIYKSQYPADFICEAIDQTRGWFYVLLATSVMLTGKSSYKNVICTNHILDERGRKMSKSVGNVIEPLPFFEKFGADAVRWSMFRTDPWLPKRFGESVVMEASGVLLRPLWNVYSFFVTYANIDKFSPAKLGKKGLSAPKPKQPKSKHILDRWILAELADTTGVVTDRLEHYDITPAVLRLERFVEGLSNWYVRRGRRRYWKSQNDADKEAAENTLYYVLVRLSQLLAPLVPFVSEEIYRNLTSGGLYVDERGLESVHLTDWPKVGQSSAADKKLVKEMRLAQQLVSLARSARQEAKLRVRQPLARLVVALPAKVKITKTTEELIKDEVNVKSLEYVKNPDELGQAVVKLNFAVAGKKYGAKVKEIAKALAVTPSIKFGKQGAKVGKFGLDDEDLLVTYQGKKDLAVAGDRDVLVGLDTKLTPELEQEGLIRELIRAVQDLRKEAGYDVSDRIVLRILSSDKLVGLALKKFGSQLKGETLAVRLETTAGLIDKKADFKLDQHSATVAVKKHAPV
ncbi:MAG: isoleucine--tRNA ligase [Parcubacteria group bacterium]